MWPHRLQTSVALEGEAMKHNIEFKHSEPEERVRKLVEELKLEEIISEIPVLVHK